jgi:hypothetical protein
MKTPRAALSPSTKGGETIDYFYRCGTQLEMEEAIAGWLRNQITRIEHSLRNR